MNDDSGPMPLDGPKRKVFKYDPSVNVTSVIGIVVFVASMIGMVFTYSSDQTKRDIAIAQVKADVLAYRLEVKEELATYRSETRGEFARIDQRSGELQRAMIDANQSLAVVKFQLAQPGRR